MKLFKKYILLIVILYANSIYSQETQKIEKVKIGKHKYETYHKYFNNYEVNEQGYSLFYKKGGKEQSICPCIFYKDNNILSISDVIVEEKKGLITCILKILVKRIDFDADSIKYVKKQNKKGFFDPVLTVEYTNGKEKVLFKK